MVKEKNKQDENHEERKSKEAKIPIFSNCAWHPIESLLFAL